jgi:hypothetical protein
MDRASFERTLAKINEYFIEAEKGKKEQRAKARALITREFKSKQSPPFLLLPSSRSNR